MSSKFFEQLRFIDRESSELSATQTRRFTEEGAAVFSTQENEAALKAAEHNFAGRQA